MAGGGPGGSALPEAVEATARRTSEWLSGPSQRPFLAERIARVAAHFPDLPIGLDLAGLAVRLEPETMDVLERAVHTLLGNVRAHASASQVTLRGTGTARGWTLTIADDGRGFDMAASLPGLGLTRYTRDPLREVGVSMRLDSAPGAGTRCVLVAGQSPADRQAQSATDAGAAPKAPAPARRMRGRFAAWRARPVRGRARADSMIDISGGLFLAMFWGMVLCGTGALLNRSARPALALALVLAVAVAWTLLWLERPGTSASWPVLLAVSSAGAGVAVTWLAGATASSGSNLGIFVASWPAIFLVGTRPERRYLAIPLILLQAAAVARVDLAAAVLFGLWSASACAVAGALASWLKDLGAQADADLLAAEQAERRLAAYLVSRQVKVMCAAVSEPDLDSELRDRLGRIVRDSEEYLRPGSHATRLQAALETCVASHAMRASRVKVDVSYLTEDLPPLVTDCLAQAVSALVSGLAGRPGSGPVSVRAAGDSCGWQLTVLDTDHPGIDPGAGIDALIPSQTLAQLSQAGIAATCRSFPAGGLHVLLSNR